MTLCHKFCMLHLAILVLTSLTCEDVRTHLRNAECCGPDTASKEIDDVPIFRTPAVDPPIPSHWANDLIVWGHNFGRHPSDDEYQCARDRLMDGTVLENNLELELIEDGEFDVFRGTRARGGKHYCVQLKNAALVFAQRHAHGPGDFSTTRATLLPVRHEAVHVDLHWASRLIAARGDVLAAEGEPEKRPRMRRIGRARLGPDQIGGRSAAFIDADARRTFFFSPSSRNNNASLARAMLAPGGGHRHGRNHVCRRNLFGLTAESLSGAEKVFSRSRAGSTSTTTCRSSTCTATTRIW